MKACSKCGREVDEGSYYCKFCGTTIDSKFKNSIKSSELRGIVEKRLNAIKNHDEVILGEVMEKPDYSKFDDWPPFALQDSTEALENEEGAYKAIKKYDYEIKDYKEEYLNDAALAMFNIHYWGSIRDRDFDVNSRVTIVLKKHNTSWLVVHEHWSRFPEQKQRRGIFG